MKVGIIFQNLVKFRPVSVFDEANLPGFFFASGGDIKHDVSVVGVRVKVTNVPVTDKVSTSGVGYCEVNH